MTSRPLLRTSRTDVSARKTYDLIDEPCGPEYDALLDGALAQCTTAVVWITGGERPAAAVEALASHLMGENAPGSRTVLRYRYNRDSAAVFKQLARGLYAWRQPQLPEDLALLRADGSPWLVSIARERLGYLELTPFEKLLLGRSAPGLVAVLAHQAARDAVAAYLERRYESHVEALAADLLRYAERMLREGREQVVEALSAWLESGDEVRVSAALEVVRALGVSELRREVSAVRRALDEPHAVDAAFRDNVLLRDRWRARRRRALEAAQDAMSEHRRTQEASSGA